MKIEFLEDDLNTLKTILDHSLRTGGLSVLPLVNRVSNVVERGLAEAKKFESEAKMAVDKVAEEVKNRTAGV
jgi:hypothetical protein